MTRDRKTLLHRASALMLVAALAATGSPPAAAQDASEREGLEALRETTLALIEALVQSGVLTREKADALLADAKKRAADKLAAAGAPKPAAPAVVAMPTVPAVRVPYVPQVVRDQIRNEVREEVLARARAERWGVPNATAEWTDRLSIEGDLRVRHQTDHLAGGNLTPEEFLTASLSGATRAADLAAATATGLTTGNTQDDRERLRLRARLAFNARVSDGVTAGLRLATGSATDRVSTNQTLGQNFNRANFLLDRAFIKIEPAEWGSFSAGRIANPWFSTDMVWNDNLNFEGVAAHFRRPADPAATVFPFATVGYFPIREASVQRSRRSITGAQIGLQWEGSAKLRVRLGLAAYEFNHFAGQVDNDFDATFGAGPTYGQYEYEAGLRQRGNTLFLTNSPLELAPGITPERTRWGQAARFRPLVLTAAAEFSHFAPVFVGLTGEVVRNQAYHREEIARRTGGLYLDDARVFGVTLRGTVGAQQVRNLGDWQLSVMARWLGSDAMPDAFVDSDLVLGGTNVKGFAVGFNYGLARDTQLGLRLLSGRSISSPTVRPSRQDRFGSDSLQVDLNVRF
jgi:Putative porin